MQLRSVHAPLKLWVLPSRQCQPGRTAGRYGPARAPGRRRRAAVAVEVFPVVTTTTTLPAPIGDIESLLTQLHTEATGLGQLVVDGKTSEAALIVARADAIWVAIEPQILESKIDIAEDVKRIVDLFHTAAERKRPADADKAVRFTTLMLESVPQLLNK